MNFPTGHLLTHFCILLAILGSIIGSSFDEVFNPTDQTSVITLLEQRLELSHHFEKYWENFERQLTVAGDVFITFEIEKPTNSQLMAALHERFNAFLTNVFARACVLFYGNDAAGLKETHNIEKSEKCNNVADFLALYNRKFSALDFYTASELSKRSTPGCKTSEKTEFTIKNIVYMIDELLIDLQRMNNLFMKEESTSDSLLKNLEKMSLYSETETKATLQSFIKWNSKPELINFFQRATSQRQKYLPAKIKNEENKVIRYHDDIWKTLLLFFGPNLVNVQKYFLAFFKAPFKLESVDTFVVPHMSVSVSFWECIVDFENTSGLRLSSISRVPHLENELFKMVPRILHIPDAAEINLKWRIDCGENYISDYEMKIIENDDSDKMKIIEDDNSEKMKIIEDDDPDYESKIAEVN